MLYVLRQHLRKKLDKPYTNNPLSKQIKMTSIFARTRSSHSTEYTDIETSVHSYNPTNCLQTDRSGHINYTRHWSSITPTPAHYVRFPSTVRNNVHYCQFDPINAKSLKFKLEKVANFLDVFAQSCGTFLFRNIFNSHRPRLLWW